MAERSRLLSGRRELGRPGYRQCECYGKTSAGRRKYLYVGPLSTHTHPRAVQDEAAGRIHTFFADSLEPSAFSRKFLMSLGGQVPTAAHASFTDLFTANKEGALARYSLVDLKMIGSPFGQIHTGDKKTGKKNGSKGKPGKNKVNTKVNGVNDKAGSAGHTGAVLCLAASEDGKYLLTGGKDKVIGVWQVDAASDVPEDGSGAAVKWLRGLSGHKDAVTVSRHASIRDMHPHRVYDRLTFPHTRHSRYRRSTTLPINSSLLPPLDRYAFTRSQPFP